MRTIVTRPSNIATNVAAAERREQQLRLRLWHTLARRIPLNRRFATHAELSEWAERALAQLGITRLAGANCDRLTSVLGDMWRTVLLLETDPPSKRLIEQMGHGPGLLEAWRCASRIQQRHRAREGA